MTNFIDSEKNLSRILKMRPFPSIKFLSDDFFIFSFYDGVAALPVLVPFLFSATVQFYTYLKKYSLINNVFSNKISFKNFLSYKKIRFNCSFEVQFEVKIRRENMIFFKIFSQFFGFKFSRLILKSNIIKMVPLDLFPE